MKKLDVRGIVKISIFTTLIIICSWISVPFFIPLTMQLFAVFLASAVLGGKKALICVIIYILLGAAGGAVFSGGRAGLQVIFGMTGGYILGFLPCAYISGKLCEKNKKKPWTLFFSMLFGLLTDYFCGILWILIFYAARGEMDPSLNAAVFGTLLFFIPDCIKILLAVLVARRILKVKG